MMSQVVIKTDSKMWKLKSLIILAHSSHALFLFELLHQVVVANMQLQIAIAWVF